MSEARVRRTTTRKVNYAKVQEFSDEDLFEDDEVPAPIVTAAPIRRKKVRKPRASNASLNALSSADQQEYGSSYDETRPIYTEKGYDPSLPPIRERFPFMPEYEEDGTLRIELIIGRRPVDEATKENDGVESDGDDGEEKKEQEVSPRKKRSAKTKTTGTEEEKDDMNVKKEGFDSNETGSSSFVEYEYLVKYKGRSYLHLEWKTGADLESMNKSAKGIYRRYLKKLTQGVDEEMENPEFDPSFVLPEKILDEAEQEMVIEMTDKELLRWEKQREKELALDAGDEIDDTGEDIKTAQQDITSKTPENIRAEGSVTTDDADIDELLNRDNIDFSKVPMEKLRLRVNREGPYYPVVEGCDNPYRDGYFTEPPRKPRASYLIFQSAMRLSYQRNNPQSTLQSELNSSLGDVWRKMPDAEKAPFLQLAVEETKQYEAEKELLEKAQKPNGVWQPMRRCRMVLDRICGDSFAEIFLHPVPLEDFPDYTDFIDQPMDLSTVRKRLEGKKYLACEQFARDMRKIFNNCKIYNTHGSAIWYVADFMSKQFERLYHAWVLEFRERYIRWVDPRARPWEHSCRIRDGKCRTPDEKMVLCDHCDGMYGLVCLDPPLKKVPKQAWHCPDCKQRFNSTKGARMLSAVAENAARKRAELGDLPKKKITQTMYLVKWAGLGYEFCTWETRRDIGSDKLISEFHKVNKSDLSEPDLKEEVIDNFLGDTKHINIENAGGTNGIPDLRSQLYAQCRSFQFAKFGENLPEKLSCEIGSKTLACCHGIPSFFCTEKSVLTTKPRYQREVVECLSELTFTVAKNIVSSNVQKSFLLSPPLTGEYDATIPITSKGLMMNVGEVNGSVAFLGYRQFSDGTKGPAEEQKLIRNIGDKILTVDGVSTIGKSFKDVIAMLRESGKNKFAYMRLLDCIYSVCENNLVSVASKGRYAQVELQSKFAADRQRALIERPNQAEQVDDIELTEELNKDCNSDDESEHGSEGSFSPESEDDELLDRMVEDEVELKKSEYAAKSPVEKASSANVNGNHVNDSVMGDTTHDNVPKESSAAENIDIDVPNNIPSKQLEIEPLVANIQSIKPNTSEKPFHYRSETTRSLAFRLLDVEVGYSSDEAGDEDYAYFLDGVDGTFTNDRIVRDAPKNTADENEEVTLPAKQNDFLVHGDRAKLAAAVALCTKLPDINDFDNFPYPSSKEMEAQLEKDREDLMEKNEGLTKRSTVKVEQISVATGETIHVWANVEAASATLQLPLTQLKQVLLNEYDEEIGDEVGGFKWSYALTSAKVTAGNQLRGGGGKKAKEAWLQFREKLYDPSEPHIYKNGNRLRDYQVDGVNWLASTWYKRQGCILSDEMGLGKTVQIVCYIDHLFRVEKIKRPFLVVVPLSTVEHWRREFEGWTDMICCVYHDRQRIWRDVMREYEWYYEDRPHTAEFLKFDVIVTTYDTLISDFDVISQIPFRVSVVDEAHRLRNQKGKLLECMREVSARATLQYGFQSRVLMSGTPLQNDLTELWTLLNFIEPFKFSDLDNFMVKFGNMANRAEVESLQKLISPYMLRRVKEDVAKDIPSKEETLIDVELTSIQKQFYRAIFEHNLAFLNIGATRQTAPKLMNIQMELRKVCNHPYLLEGVEYRESDRLYKEFSENGTFEGKTPIEQHKIINEHGFIMASGKMVLLDKLLPKLRQEGHKILIFSQMVKMLDLISDYCDFRGFRYERLDGRVRGTERQKAIDRFEKEADSFLFLLSTRAGGVGINLTAADICIIFDSDWNPQNDVQAQARCHRIGQTKDVRIYRLITSRSFEQEMFERASRKLGLEQAILGTFEKDAEDDKPTQQEMEQLLKKGAYALLDDDNDEIIREFCADDIESILAKRTRTRVVEGTKTASWLNKQGLVVSKSKFTAESGISLDMDDPQFWQKVMPNFVTPTIMLQKLNDLQDEVEGKMNKVTGPGRGRGRGRPKRSDVIAENNDLLIMENGVSTDVKIGLADDAAKEVDEVAEMSSDEAEERKENDSKQLTRKNIRNIQAFMSDIKSMMESILEDAEDEGMKPEEKEICQKLLLTVSVKDKIFSDEQRRIAKIFLKRLEGDRRRRCRTSEQQRFQPGAETDEPVHRIREELRIVGKKKKKRQKRSDDDADVSMPQSKRKRRSKDVHDTLVDDDAYLQHSDSEADWSDVGDHSYLDGTKGKDRISLKEASRRRQWGSDDDAATAAGRAWPVFPRHRVKEVLETLLEAVMKNDEESGGHFSVPVSVEDFPEYYEHIENPMDYGTMVNKLENDEYRSAQAMQKDFVLILQNCRQFNSNSSDIVKEAREQHLIRPHFLKNAAKKHGLFLAEDGSVLEIIDDEKVKSSKQGNQDLENDGKGIKLKKKKKKTDKDEPNTDEVKKARKMHKKKILKNRDVEDDGTVQYPITDTPSSAKPKIRIKLRLSTQDDVVPTSGLHTDEPKMAQKGLKIKKKKKLVEDSAINDKNDARSTEQGERKKRRLSEKKDSAIYEDIENDDSSAEQVGRKKRRLSEKIPKKNNLGKKKKIEDGKEPKKEKRDIKDSKRKTVKLTMGDPAIYLDTLLWKTRRENLDGKYESAMQNFTEGGPWVLPLPLLETHFDEIAENTLNKMEKHDKYSVFAEPVSVPGYDDVIKTPMDFGTMRSKVKKGRYGTGNNAVTAFYGDFHLVFENCRSYNPEGSDVNAEGARILAYLPEAYTLACVNVSKTA